MAICKTGKGFGKKEKREKQTKFALLRFAIAEEISGERKNNPFNLLSSREFVIVQHLIKGESISQIQHTLNLKASTVSTYKARIFEKLKCKKTIELNQLTRIYNVIPFA